jgi:hypothetical protein
MKANVSAFLCGAVFALGLGLSGMTQPSKVIGFLDVAGRWDPSLAFVMLGAIGVHFVFVRIAKRRAAPRFAAGFVWPTAKSVDAPLIVGALIFGVGWGMAGYCPGPALVSLASFAPSVVVFVAAMAVGTLVAGKTAPTYE